MTDENLNFEIFDQLIFFHLASHKCLGSDEWNLIESQIDALL